MKENSYTNGGFVPSSVDLSQLPADEPAHGGSCYDLNQNQVCTISGKAPPYDVILKPYSSSFSSSTDSSTKDLETQTIEYEVQSTLSVLRQMLLPFTVAGIGSVFAGVVLNKVIKWRVFDEIPQFEIMVPAFLGLIGNIETTLASRLSTQANLGRLDTWAGIKEIMTGNILVVQCQSSTVGLFAAFASTMISLFKEETRSSVTLDNILVLCVSSVVTSILANTILLATISLVIIIARKFRINPDNISTPVAASMGDVCSIAILAHIASLFYEMDSRLFKIVVITILLLIAPILGYFARQNRYTKSVVVTGWTAILGAVIVEQPGGLVMQSAFSQYETLSTFQPLVNGIGSNLVGIQTSRMSTFLHSVSKKGQLPDSNPRYLESPIKVFFSSDTHAKMARLLMLVIIPAHMFYMGFIYLIRGPFDIAIELTIPFLVAYNIAIVVQLIILLYLAYLSVFFAWKHRINPDNSAIPFTSALADVLGNCLMAIAFTILKGLNDKNTQIFSPTTLGPTTDLLLNGTTSSVFADATTLLATTLKP